MNVSSLVALIAGSYLFGSVPFGLLIGLGFKGIDVRSYGSGNIGFSNVLRLLGWPAGLLCLVLDLAKGLVPVWIAISLEADPLVVVGAGLAAIMGHNYSIFLKFRGGKGVATSLGVLIGLVPQLAVIIAFIWVLVVSLTRYISVASIVAGIMVPVLMLLSSRANDSYIGRPIPQEYLYLGVVGAGFVVLKHRSNLIRLMNGTEPRMGQRVRVDVEALDEDHQTGASAGPSPAEQGHERL